MIETIFLHAQNGYAYVKKNPQILTTLVLVVIIPISFLFSGQQFLSVARNNQETLERERIGTLHDALFSFIYFARNSEENLQSEISRIVLLNSDISELIIARESEDSAIVTAALDSSLIGSPVTDMTALNRVYVDPDKSFLIQKVHEGVRYWEGYRLVVTPAGVTYFIYTKTSLAHIDQLFADRILRAYYWLFGILVIVLLLVVRHVRLIDYSYLYRETKKANQMKDLFTNMIAHELRSPLTAIRGYGSLLREAPNASEETTHIARKIEDASSRLLLIVNDLLDVARIQSGKIAIQNEKVDIVPIIADVIDLMTVQAEAKGIALINGTQRTALYINGDSKRLIQAFTNLISNGIKYTKAGSITVSIEEMRDRVEVRVKDTGMGISAENQSQLFAPFFRVANPETENTVGTGLGMWITKQLIELMHGSIAVESIRGVGTHIVVTLPK
jgi:signal transduction histidine kinase